MIRYAKSNFQRNYNICHISFVIIAGSPRNNYCLSGLPKKQKMPNLSYLKMMVLYSSPCFLIFCSFFNWTHTSTHTLCTHTLCSKHWITFGGCTSVHIDLHGVVGSDCTHLCPIHNLTTCDFQYLKWWPFWFNPVDDKIKKMMKNIWLNLPNINSMSLPSYNCHSFVIDVRTHG